MLADAFAGMEEDVTEENLQSRARGNVLMALSNKFGWIVLSTGNKSEMSVGYSTLYGDTAGGFAVIKDVPKVLVYCICHYVNETTASEVIPGSVLTKEPSAELRPGQRDVDSLPPYEVLDPILEAYIEDDKGVGEIVAGGFEEEDVRRVIRMVDRAEYKRRQAPIGIKVTSRAFGRDRRVPMTNRYSERDPAGSNTSSTLRKWRLLHFPAPELEYLVDVVMLFGGEILESPSLCLNRSLTAG